jgi:uncharacterized protein (DUF2132 family)
LKTKWFAKLHLVTLISKLKNMDKHQKNNPLHGVKLEMILNYLVEAYGWETLGMIIEIRCFNYDPSIKSSLTFLRKTPWARAKVEELYLKTVK